MSNSFDIRIVNFIKKMSDIYIKKRNSDVEDESTISTVKHHIRPYMDADKQIIVIDIGTHQGVFIDELKKYYKINKAILFEPIPELAYFLKKKFIEDKYIVYECALSNKISIDQIFIQNKGSYTSSLLTISKSFESLAEDKAKIEKILKINTMTLDFVIEENNITYIDLIKLDVQGAEHLVLEGGKKTLSKTKFLWTEVSFKPLYEGSCIFNTIYDQLVSQGFYMLDIVPGYRYETNELLQADVLFVNKNLN